VGVHTHKKQNGRVYVKRSKGHYPFVGSALRKHPEMGYIYVKLYRASERRRDRSDHVTVGRRIILKYILRS
jgi:hypothetical protein